MMIAQNLISGLNTSAILLLCALGLVIIFGLMNVINMAHGELIMLGAYMTYFTTNRLGLVFAAGLIAAFMVAGLIGALIEILVIKKFYSQPTETILATFAISLVLERSVYLVFGAETRNIPMPIPGTMHIMGVAIPYYNIFVILFAAALLAALILIFMKTKFGKKIRAITQNRSMTECLGVEVRRVDTWTFAFGAALAGLAGAMLSPLVSVTSGMGAPYLTESFMTVVVGGVQSVLGAALGAGIVGESRTILGGLTNAVAAKIMICLMIILIIRLRPEGLFSRKRR
jgi:urea transport system permease protein